jgi:hypothetical protein
MTDALSDFIQDLRDCTGWCLCGHAAPWHSQARGLVTTAEEDTGCRYTDCWCPIFRSDEEER